MNLKECLEKEIIKKVEPNKERALSLIKISDLKEEVVRIAKLNERSIYAYISIAYDSLREFMEAIAIIHGYKVLNHICLGEIIKKILPVFDENKFNQIRWIRNAINYYGEEISYEEGKRIISLTLDLKKELREKIREMVEL